MTNKPRNPLRSKPQPKANAPYCDRCGDRLSFTKIFASYDPEQIGWWCKPCLKAAFPATYRFIVSVQREI